MVSLQIAAEHNCESIAFPLISSGVYGYPKPEAFRVAVDTCSKFLETHEMDIFIVVFDKRGYNIGKQYDSALEEFIDQNYVDESEKRFSYSRNIFREAAAGAAKSEAIEEDRCLACDESLTLGSIPDDFELDESFTQMVLRKIDEKGMTDPECYKKANIDRKLFSKIRSDLHYNPSKKTAVALGIALELPMKEFEELLRKAGFALSNSNLFDVVIRFFVSNGIYDVFEINEALFARDLEVI